MRIKTGYCVECGNTEHKPIITNKCQYHYWKSKAKPIERKPIKIKHTSDKRQIQLAEYRKLRDKFFIENPICQYPNCASKEIDLHHAKGRVGSLLTDVKYFRSLCRKHHIWVEENPILAKELGLSFDRL